MREVASKRSPRCADRYCVAPTMKLTGTSAAVASVVHPWTRDMSIGDVRGIGRAIYVVVFTKCGACRMLVN
jgi:hypothetical protein